MTNLQTLITDASSSLNAVELQTTAFLSAETGQPEVFEFNKVDWTNEQVKEINAKRLRNFNDQMRMSAFVQGYEVEPLVLLDEPAN